MSSTRQRKHTTRKSTLHRLKVPQGEVADLRGLVRNRYLESPDHTVRDFTAEGIEGVLVTGGVPRERADWCTAVEAITGLEVSERSHSAAGLILMRTERGFYALSYGVGHHMLDPSHRDDDFGLEFATRSLDEDGVIKVRNQIMDGRGRVDEYSVARGERIDGFGLDRIGAIVRRLCGTVSGIPLTSVRDGKAHQVRVECAASTIKLPLATRPEDFLSDLRAIEEICARPESLPELRFVDRVRTLAPSGHKAEEATGALERLLADPDSPRLALSVPESCLEAFGSAQAFRLTRPNHGRQEVTDLNLAALLRFVGDEDAGDRLKALGEVRVTLYADDDCRTPASSSTKGSEWLIADVPVGAHRYFYGQGKWYEVGAEFLETLEEELRELFARRGTVTLPAWPKGARDSKGRDSHDEAWYNEEVAKQPGYTLFDKKTVVTDRFNGGGLEICDVLGPRGELICVKKASQTASLNHLFAQGVVAVETLRTDLEVREKFRAQVAARAGGHSVPEDLGGLRVVFGILLKEGRDITVDSLFAFAQVSLLNAARRLRAMQAEVEVIPILR
ncbi:TIGR04141 family sporadically distributed protein (plasmid) [Streptomyces sp. M92]|nr:TIGR04141 family sporadically distributed protein [Streptomyces sp. M92]